MSQPTFPPRFEVRSELVDSQGRVFLARDRETGAPCRLVQVAPGGDGPLTLRRAHAEHGLMGDAHGARPLDWGALDDGSWYRAEAWVEPLASIPAELSLHVAAWLKGLATLHAAGRVHGGLHMGALGLAADGTPCLTSPGRGWRVGQPAMPVLAQDPSWPYLAPELWSHGRVDARTDLFMLGALLLQWLSDGAVTTPCTSDELAIALDSLPPAWSGWVDLLGGLLAPAPDDRFANASEALAELPGALPIALPAPLGQVSTFVGRRAELLRLLTLLDEAVDTLEPRAVTLVGPSNVGKSRLLEELRQRARSRGCTVAYASATQGGQAPYASILPLVELLWGLVPPGVQQTLAPVLAALLPNLGPAVPELEPQAARTRLFAAIADLVEAAAAPPGLLVCLDDWQAADAASQELIAFLGRALPPLPLALVLATRKASPEQAGWPQAVQILLAGAPRKETGWRVRLQALPASARRLACAVAVVGPGAGLAFLQGVAGLAEGPFVAALDVLAEAGVLALGGPRLLLLAPAEPLYALVDAAGLRAFHAAALSRCQLAKQLGEPIAPARLARHALASERLAEGALYALAAARQALALFALGDAEVWLTRGATCLDRCEYGLEDGTLGYLVARGDLERYRAHGPEAERCYRAALGVPGLPAAQRAEVLVSLGIALNLNARWEEAEALYREAIQLPALPGPVRARALTALARLDVRLGRGPEAMRVCHEVLAIADAPLAVRGEALGLLGLVCVSHGGDVREGLGHLAAARALAGETGCRLALSDACMLAGNAHYGLGQLEAARVEFSRYALICHELGLPDEALCASLNLAQVAYAQGRYVEAWQRARAGATASQRDGNKVYESFAWTYVALAGMQLGYLTEADAAGRQAQLVAETLGEGPTRQAGVARLELALFLGRFGQAEEQALALAVGAVGAEAGAIALALGTVYAMSNEPSASIEQLRRARTVAVETSDQALLANVAVVSAQVALAAGQIAVAHARGLEALDLAACAGASLAELRAHLVIAHTAWQLGEPGETERHLAAAQTLAEALASPHWQAIAWLALARLRPDGVALRQKAATYMQFHLQQLPPRARQEFLNWPERRDALTGRGTTALELRVPALKPGEGTLEARS